MKKKIKKLQELKQVNQICKSKLKHLKGGEIIGDARTRAEVE